MERVEKLLRSDVEKGISTEEALRRQMEYGPNIVTIPSGPGAIVRFLLQFHNPLIYILLAAGTVTAALNSPVDASVIFGVVLLNAIIGFVQEARAEEALNALQELVYTEATVLRDGRRQRLASEELVPGDIVFLHSGDKVPADIRLRQARDVQVNESSLTGESLPVFKRVELLPLDTILAERCNTCHAGTVLTYGQGQGIVIATGDATETGRIAHLLAATLNLETPLTRKIGIFSRRLLYVILGLSALTFAVGLFRSQPVFDMFMASVALAVGAIPEGLPAAVTITLAIGVNRMARRKAIVRRLPAVETLGSTTVICSDKTGTLTENQMTVCRLLAGKRHYTVSGTGYAPAGLISWKQEPIRAADDGALNECLTASVLCNDSLILQKDGRWLAEGDPTEAALLTAAAKGGLDALRLQERFPRLDAIPFESDLQLMATLHSGFEDDRRRVYLKGSVEAILARCDGVTSEGDSESDFQRSVIVEAADAMAAAGLRVLALARKTFMPSREELSLHDIEAGLTFLGLQAMIDPPRPEAIKAVNSCQQAGIQVKMITGDHALTAATIARRLGIKVAAEGRVAAVVSGAQLVGINDEELQRIVKQTNVFARVAPEQKLRLVTALQANNHVVAMTGDGVNDAPALKQADIGIAMGYSGTDAAREAADILLMDDNFASIEAAVEEGRNVFDNLIKFIVWTLPTSLGEGLIILTAIVLGMTLPILPVQILWINMTTAVFLGLMLAFEPGESGLMERPPREPQRPILSKPLLTRIALVGGIMLLGSYGLFQWEIAHGASLDTARSVVVNLIVLIELVYLFNCRSLLRSIFGVSLITNLWVFGGALLTFFLQIAFTYLSFMNDIFHSAPIALEAWLRIGAVAAISLVIVEVEKRLLARRRTDI